MVGSPLAAAPGGDLRVWLEYSRVDVVRRVVSTWSARSCTVTLRDDFYLVSERGEEPVEECVQRARVELPRGVTLFVDGPYYHFDGPPADVVAVETRWLAILKRDYFRFSWLDHPLVPDAWPLETQDVSISPTYNRFLPGGAGECRYRPVVLLARHGSRCSGLLLDQDRALPLGPLPLEPGVLLFQCRRPGGQSALDVPETFRRLVDGAGTVAETTRNEGRVQAPLGFLTMHRTGELEHVSFRAWRAGSWILRSQHGHPYRAGPTTLSGDFDHQWAVQNDDGGPWAILAQRTRVLFSQEEEMSVRVVGEGSAAAEVARRLRSVLARDGWSCQEVSGSEPGGG
jgi:hypothetical protein